MHPYSLLVSKAEKFSTQLISNGIGYDRSFHNLTHTQRVVKNCLKLAQLQSCSYEEIEQLLVAAWFHDTGYISGSGGHEQMSMKIFMEFMKGLDRGNGFTQTVVNLILATKMPTAPNNMLEEILCDADTSHLGSAEYALCQEQLRRELQFSEEIVMSDKDWTLRNIAFFQEHHYYTGQARALWNEQKQINLRRLQLLSEGES